MDQNPVSFRILKKPSMSKGPAMGPILGWQLKALGGSNRHCGCWWWCWLVVGLLLPSHLACGVSVGGMTCSDVAGWVLHASKMLTACSYCGLWMKRSVVRSSARDVLWVKCFLMFRLNLWMGIWGCGPLYHLLLLGRVWPHLYPPSLRMSQLGTARRCS